MKNVLIILILLELINIIVPNLVILLDLIKKLNKRKNVLMIVKMMMNIYMN